MSDPNAFLCGIYGTSKVAGAASTLAAGFLTHKMIQSDQEHTARLLAEAEQMNRIVRVLEERKMRATVRGLGLARGGIAPDLTNYEDMGWGDLSLFKGGSTKHVEDAARTLAQLGMDKEGFGGAIFAKALSGLGSKLLGLASKGGGGAVSKLVGRAGAGVSRGAARLGGVAKTQAMPAISGVTSKGTQVMGAAAKAPAAAGFAKPTAGGSKFWNQIMGGRVGAPGGPNLPKNLTSAAPTAGGQKGFLSGLMGGGGGGKAAPSMMQRVKGAVTPSWKTKALVGGAGLAAMGAVYSGAKATKGYMTTPSGTGGWRGRGSYGLRHNVSNFGGGYTY